MHKRHSCTREERWIQNAHPGQHVVRVDVKPSPCLASTPSPLPGYPGRRQPIGVDPLGQLHHAAHRSRSYPSSVTE